MAQKAFPISPQPSDIGHHIGYDIEGNDDEEQEKEDQM